MATEVRLPELGENITEGDITKLLVKVGDTIVPDQAMVEMETGKATLEVPSAAGGTVKEIRVSEGQKVKVGEVILVLDGATGTPAPAKPSPVRSDPPGAKPAPVTPSIAEKPAPPAPATAATVVPPPPSPGVAVAAAPSVRKFAREIGLDVAQVPGSGPGGRISIEDVKAYSKRLHEGRGAPAAGVAAPPLPDFAQWGPVEREPMNNIRKITVQHLSVCWTTIPHVTQHDRADITELELLRKRFGKKAEEAGGKLTTTAILLKVVASALKVFPKFNASVDVARQQIVYKKYIHIGVAVDTPKGLLVPVLRDVDKKNIIDLAVELTKVADHVRGGKIAPSDMQGGTFTISNLGGIGGTYFTPLVNHPEVALLGIGRAAQEPVLVEGEFVPRLMLPLSLSYDHRLIDGADGARFLRWIAEAITEPLLLALEG